MSSSGSKDPTSSDEETTDLLGSDVEQLELEEGAKGAREPPWRSIGVKVAVSILLFVALSLLLEHFCEEQVSAFASALMDRIGIPGLFLAVVFADGVPQPFTYVPLIFIAVKADVPKLEVFGVCAAASFTAALMGYGVGMRIRKLECGQKLFNRMADDHPYIPELMQKKGALGVALAALLPVPLAMATWTAGYLEIFFPTFVLAGLCRIPKITVFVLLSRGPQAPETSQ
mmetsp:Transcript_108729/g.307534  ORF Transcript_108729/g.307534 Transcript_108729/m.307534 type:complete len:229 (+) Transcript_108729:238-924(+)